MSYILIADDSPTIKSVLKMMLKPKGYTVATAPDGIEAIKKVYQNPPDLILMDIEMPRMNGYQTCRLLKDDPMTKDIPVIILTAQSFKSSRFWGLATGADFFLPKSSNMEGLLEKIEEIFSNQDNAGSQNKAVTEAVDETQILERVAQLLDRKLFQSTVINELGKLARDMGALDKTVDDAFELLNNMIDFKAASMLLKDETKRLWHIYLSHPATKTFLEDYEKHILKSCADNDIKCNPEDLEVFLTESDESKEGESRRNEELESHSDFLLEVRGEIIGILSIANPTYETAAEEEKFETLRIFADVMATVVDNALLFKNLKHTQQELIKSQRELLKFVSQLEE